SSSPAPTEDLSADLPATNGSASCSSGASTGKSAESGSSPITVATLRIDETSVRLLSTTTVKPTERLSPNGTSTVHDSSPSTTEPPSATRESVVWAGTLSVMTMPAQSTSPMLVTVIGSVTLPPP